MNMDHSRSCSIYNVLYNITIFGKNFKRNRKARLYATIEYETIRDKSTSVYWSVN